MKTLYYLFVSFRPHQWIKNFFLFAGIIFAQKLFAWDMFFIVLKAFVLFCLVSGLAYLINDIHDRQNDAKDPNKSKRPIASGKVSVSVALAAFFILLPCILFLCYYLDKVFFKIVLIYLILQFLYSFYLKKKVIIDVLAVAAGFVLRVIAGAVVIDVYISSWLLLCTFLLALFLALAKRRYEIITLQPGMFGRQVLREYNPYLMDQMISIVTASSVLSFALYTISEETVAKFGTSNLLFTIPFVIYGIFRYLYLIHHKRERYGVPERLILEDKPLLLNIFLWVAVAGFVIYFT